jgi:hypothetical protein
MDRLLPNPGILGRDQEGTSGRAQLVQQSAGLTELADAFANLTDFELRVHRQVWARCRQFWTNARWLRTTDDLSAPQYLQINVPVLDEIGFPVIDPQTGQPQMAAQVAQLDVDIMLDVVPEAPSANHEQFAQLAQMAANGVPIPPELLIESSSLRNKAKIIEGIQQMRAQQAQAQQAASQAQGEKLSAEARRASAQAQEIEFRTGLSASQPVMPGMPGAVQ